MRAACTHGTAKRRLCKFELRRVWNIELTLFTELEVRQTGLGPDLVSGRRLAAEPSMAILHALRSRRTLAWTQQANVLAGGQVSAICVQATRFDLWKGKTTIL